MNAIKINLTECKNSEDCLSHLFGCPVVPESLNSQICELDADIMFFGQFDLSDLASLDTENKLPHKGFLYIFLDTSTYPYQAKTFYTADSPKYVIDDFNSQVLDFEEFTTPFAMTFEKCDGDTDGTKLFGVPSWERNCDDELFMQFDPLDNDTGFLYNIDGYAFFTFGDKKRSLENIKFSMDYS